MPRRSELRQQFQQLAIAHQRVSAHERQVQRAMLLHQPQNAPYQVAALAVGKLPQGYAGCAEVRIFVGIATGTAQRTFAR